MKVTLQKSDVLAMYRLIVGLLRGPAEGLSREFSYALAKNRRLLSAEVEAIEEAFKLPNDLKEYADRRNALLMSLAKKDEKGDVVWADKEKGLLDFADKNEVPKRVAKLEEENRELLDKQRKMDEEYSKFLEQKVEIEVFGIPLAYFPADSVDYMDIIFPLVREENS